MRVERLFASIGGDAELNLNVIGDHVELRPRPLADGEIPRDGG